MLTLLYVLVSLVAVSMCFIPSTGPRIEKDQHGHISFFIKDEPGGLVDMVITMHVQKDFHVGKAIKNKESNEWYYSTSHYNLKDDDVLHYQISYIFNQGLAQRIYIGSIQFNTKTSMVPMPHPVDKRAAVVLYDDFSGNTLDFNKWYFEVSASGGGNGEFQVYCPETSNTFIKNGMLYLKPTFTADRFGENFLHQGTLDLKALWNSCTNPSENGCYRLGSQNKIPPIMSSKLFSKATITYGRVEILAKIPKGDWIWPAFWLLPPGVGKYGYWPKSGEIDIMESRGNLNLKDGGGNAQGVTQITSTIHYGKNYFSDGHRSHGHWKLAPSGTTWADDFHMYTLDWTRDHIRMEVDGQAVLSWNTPPEGYWKHEGFAGDNIWAKGGTDAPFDTNFGLILNVAVGGSRGFFSDGWNNGADGKPWKDSSPTAMMDFWTNRHQWQHTWNGDDVALKIKSVKMTQY
ncbi:hypothetical protein SNE40_012770 [Patella caerulea]|uniref:GH16 domain-containing protein n=1 Tax=Patella caerulea TaxID=87958 RepID=A0AAN8PSQ8_PATCE